MYQQFASGVPFESHKGCGLVHLPSLLTVSSSSFTAMASNATRPARGMTLEEWESKTQLTDTQKQSVLELQEACAELPLPDNVRT